MYCVARVVGFQCEISQFKDNNNNNLHILGLVACLYLGPRKGRFDIRNDPPPLSNPVYTCLGTFIIWWGWLAFNAGSSYGLTDGRLDSAARAAAGTIISSIVGGFTGLIGSMIRNKGKTTVIDVIGCILASLGEHDFNSFVNSQIGKVINTELFLLFFFIQSRDQRWMFLLFNTCERSCWFFCCNYLSRVFTSYL